LLLIVAFRFPFWKVLKNPPEGLPPKAFYLIYLIFIGFFVLSIFFYILGAINLKQTLAVGGVIPSSIFIGIILFIMVNDMHKNYQITPKEAVPIVQVETDPNTVTDPNKITDSNST
jgi:amino acid transporter